MRARTSAACRALRRCSCPATIAGRPADRMATLFDGAAVIVDALLGTGFKQGCGRHAGPVAEAIDAVNAVSAPVVSVDVPSGVDASTRRRLWQRRACRDHGHIPRGQAWAVDQAGQGARGRGRDDRHRDPPRRARDSATIGPDRALRAGLLARRDAVFDEVLLRSRARGGRLARAHRRAADGRAGEHADGRWIRDGVRTRLVAGDSRKRRSCRADDPWPAPRTLTAL